MGSGQHSDYISHRRHKKTCQPPTHRSTREPSWQMIEIPSVDLEVESSAIDTAVEATLLAVTEPSAFDQDHIDLASAIAIEISKEICWVLFPTLEDMCASHLRTSSRAGANPAEIARRVSSKSLPFPPYNWERDSRWIAEHSRWNRPRLALSLQEMRCALRRVPTLICCSPNPLMNLWPGGEDAMNVLPTPYWWTGDRRRGSGGAGRIKADRAVEALIVAFSSALSRLETIPLDLKDYLKDYFGRVFQLYTERTIPVLESRQLARFVRKAPEVLLGTGSSFGTRVLASVARREGVQTIRFDHGGDRQLYRDTLNRECELGDADDYVTFGPKGAAKYATDHRGTFLGRKDSLNVSSMGTRGLFAPRPPIEEQSRPSQQLALYLSNSFGGEFRQLPYFKPNDATYARWQEFLLSGMQDHLVYKTHPKGAQIGREIAGRCGLSIETESVQTCIPRYAVFVVDIITTAFFELICADCAVIYIDAPWRRPRLIDDEAIRRTAYVVEVSQEGSRLYLDKRQFRRCIEEAFDVGPRDCGGFVKAYVDGASPGGGMSA